MSNNIVIGRQLRAARILAGLTQKRLAQAVGVHESTTRYLGVPRPHIGLNMTQNQRPKRLTAENLVDRTVSTFGRLDCAFNNAGTIALSAIVDTTETDFRAVVDTIIGKDSLRRTKATPICRRSFFC